MYFLRFCAGVLLVLLVPGGASAQDTPCKTYIYDCNKGACGEQAQPEANGIGTCEATFQCQNANGNNRQLDPKSLLPTKAMFMDPDNPERLDSCGFFQQNGGDPPVLNPTFTWANTPDTALICVTGPSNKDQKPRINNGGDNWAVASCASSSNATTVAPTPGSTNGTTSIAPTPAATNETTLAPSPATEYEGNGTTTVAPSPATEYEGNGTTTVAPSPATEYEYEGNGTTTLAPSPATEYEGGNGTTTLAPSPGTAPPSGGSEVTGAPSTPGDGATEVPTVSGAAGRVPGLLVATLLLCLSALS